MLPRWRPTSKVDLADAEKRVLKFISTPFQLFNTVTSLGHKLWTMKTPTRADKLPLVLLHGLGAGIGIWVLNVDSLAQDRQVYAMDLLGFGRSSRPKFPLTVQGVEEDYVESIEEWRKENQLGRFTLVGHSFGGYLATLYARRYPDCVAHLILADPWGFPKMPDQTEPLPLRWRLVIGAIKPFNIFSGLRAAGPLGPRLINKIRPDLAKKFACRVKDVEAVPNYIYHCNAQDPSGEAAFKTVHREMGFAKEPLIERIADIDSKMPITFVYGAQSWMDPSTGYRVQEIREGKAPVTVELILPAGHHVYADHPDNFNSIVNEACALYD